MKIERMNEGFTLQCRWRMQKQWLAPSLLILFPCVGFSWLRYFNVYILWKDDFIEEYGAQNEAYMSRSAEKWVRGLCFNELGVCD